MKLLGAVYFVPGQTVEAGVGAECHIAFSANKLSLVMLFLGLNKQHNLGKVACQMLGARG